MNIGVILAAGKGSRLKSVDKNKTSLMLAGKPLVCYGLELYEKTCSATVVVTGFQSGTVMDCVSPAQSDRVHEAVQQELLGTGDAVKTAVAKIEELGMTPDTVFVGYGDHMMRYTPEIMQEMENLMRDSGAVMCLVAAVMPDPDGLAWGRVLRDERDMVTRIVEQKDATDEERKVTEGNAGFYCFDYAYLKEYVDQISPSPVTGEYYLPDLVSMAVDADKGVAALSVPFEQVGIGINTREQLEEAEALAAR